MKKTTKADYVEQHPGIEDWAEQLRTSDDPQLVARVRRDYWFDVEYLAWVEERWYGCVQNYQDDGWQTTDVGEYTEDQAYGLLADAAASHDGERSGYTLQAVPIRNTPLPATTKTSSATVQQVERDDACPECGQTVVDVEPVRLPLPAFKKLMYDACFFDADALEKPWRGNTVIAYHEEL